MTLTAPEAEFVAMAEEAIKLLVKAVLKFWRPKAVPGCVEDHDFVLCEDIEGAKESCPR